MDFHTHPLPFVFGILGNIISCCVFLAPLPTFYTIYKRKTTGGFQSVSYCVALFSCMLLLYYGYLKTENGTMIITINSIGCAIESTYIVLFLIYATRESLISTLKVLTIFNVASFSLIIMTTVLTTKQGHERVALVGWICAVFSVCVFVAPLSVMRMVIRTKSVEYMPFSLSFFLTLCAVTWFFYGLLIKDYYVATPNVLGFIFGVTQMILYLIYKDKNKQVINPIVQPQDEQEEQAVVDLRAILAIRQKARLELGVLMEIQEENPVEEEAEDEASTGDKKEDVAKVCVEIDGEKTIIPSIV